MKPMKLEDAKKGDAVILYSGYDRSRQICIIERATSSQLIVRGSRYRRKNGYRVGETGYWRSNISIPGDGEVDEIMRENRKAFLVDRMLQTTWTALNLETLEQIAALIPSSE